MADDEVNLPKSTIQKLIKEYLPQDMRASSEASDMLFRCCTEYVQAISSEANEISTNEKKSTIMPDHVFRAMEDLGFDEFIEAVKAAHEQWKAEQQAQVRLSGRKTAAEEAGMTEEEQIALQQQMFAAAAAQASTEAPP